jgi:hypothetical protein
MFRLSKAFKVKWRCFCRVCCKEIAPGAEAKVVYWGGSPKSSRGGDKMVVHECCSQGFNS